MKLEEMLNEEKNKEINKEFKDFYEDTLKNLPDKNRNKKSSFVKAIAVVMLCLVLTPVIKTYGTDILKNIFGVKEIINDAVTADLYLKYTNDEVVSLDFEEYKITVNNIGYDDNFLVYAYSLERKDGKDLSPDENMQIGVRLDFERNGSSYGSDVDTKIESNKFSMVVWEYIGDLNLDENIKVEVVATDYVSIFKSEKKTKLELQKSKEATSKIVVLNKEIKVPEGSIYLDEIVFSPFAAIFKSENRGKFGNINGQERDPYYYAIFDENGDQIWMGNQSRHGVSEELTKIGKTILPSEYVGKKKYTIKVYDSRTSEEVENSAITIDVPEIK